jgi:uncharacterized membrane protein
MSPEAMNHLAVFLAFAFWAVAIGIMGRRIR